jgi:ABC-type branched-subunit amino acid transport system permease subunit
MEHGGRTDRPAGITALGIFFLAGAVIAAVSCLSLSSPGGPLEPMWRLNPRARVAFSGLGLWAAALLAVVSAACAAAGVGLFRGRRWGHRLAIGLLVFNLLGDVLNTVLGTEPRAAIGIPIAGALVVYLWTVRVRKYFGERGEG